MPSFWTDIQHLQQATLGSPDVCIAILDGPVDLRHPSLQKARLTVLQPTAHALGTAAQHGTHVASTILGQPGSPVVGVAPPCRAISVPIFRENAQGHLLSSNQVELGRAIEYVLQHQEKHGGEYLINISGGERSADGESSPILKKALQKCQDRGVLIVAAAGNNGCNCLHVPAADPSVMAVGALDDAGHPMEFSNWGAAYHSNGLMAPGAHIKGALAGTDQTVLRDGTSFATPLVTGAIALLKARFPQAPFAHIKEALLATAVPCTPAQQEGQAAYCERLLRGRINLQGAAEYLHRSAEAPPTERENKPLIHTKMSETTSEVVASEASPPTETVSQAVVPSEVAAELTAADSTVEVAPSAAPTTPIPNASVVTPSAVAPSTMAPSEVSPSEVLPSAVEPSCGCQSDGQQIVYALGSLGVDFGTDAVLDSFKFYMMGIKDKEGKDIEYPNPSDPFQLLAYLNGQPDHEVPPSTFDSSRVIWTVNHDNTPIYAIKPSNAFEVEIYQRLRDFLDPAKYEDDGPDAVRIDMISVPGHIEGQVKLLSGQVIPVIRPNLRAMYNWRAMDLVKDVTEIIKTDKDKENDEWLKDGKGDIPGRILNFVNRIYFELQNLGVTSGDRAINYAATNIFNVAKAISHELSQGYVLKDINVTKSSICRPDSDCQDVMISFFNPMNRQKYAPKVWRFTIDVSRVIPVAIGEPRTWYIY
ncbi:MAG: PatA/PatG family cyanobactin maturation protease [Bacteroidota bacterium]